MQYEVVGLGNAIVDVLVRIPDDALLGQLGLTRGLMHPIDHERWIGIYHEVQTLGVEIAPGGSCCNTLSTLGLAGARVTFCGQVGDDQFGALYARAVGEACGGEHRMRTQPGGFTGKCLSLISARDAERTMCTHLGTSTELGALDAFEDSIRHSRVLHLEGYMFLGGPIREAALRAVAIAQQAGVTVSLDVSDAFVIRAVREDIWRVVRDAAGVVFLNAEEATALTGLEPGEAVHAVAAEVGTVVVKLGSQGSLVKHHGELHRVRVHPVQAVDTTGAGDAYAAGFLYGWVRGWAPQHCGDLGARFASLAVAQVGAVCRDVDALRRAVHAVAPGAV